MASLGHWEEGLIRIAAVALACAALQGCVAYTVVGAAVDVTATAVEITADVAGGVVDLATGGDDDE